MQEVTALEAFVCEHEALPLSVVREPKLITTAPGCYVIVASDDLNTIFVVRTDKEGNTEITKLTRNFNGGYSDATGKNVGMISDFCKGFQKFQILSAVFDLKSIDEVISLRYRFFIGIIRPIKGTWGCYDKFAKSGRAQLFFTGGSWVSDEGVHPSCQNQ